VTDQPRSRRELWDERHAARDPIESHDPEATLVELASSLPAGRALDLACGDGRNAAWLAARGWTVTAVDFSGVAISRARDLAERRGLTATWLERDLLEWTPPEASADLVLVAFLHLPADERRRVYAGAAGAVAPGGRLLVVAHDSTNLTHGSGGPQDPAVLFTAEDVVRDLGDGWTAERAGAVARPAGDGRQAIDAVVVARRED
jgi:SAM-dependent methyltransferase